MSDNAENYITFREYERMQKELADRDIRGKRWFIGIFIIILLAIAIPLTTNAFALVQATAIQAARIKTAEATSEAADLRQQKSMLELKAVQEAAHLDRRAIREDLVEVKANLKFLVKRAKNGQ